MRSPKLPASQNFGEDKIIMTDETPRVPLLSMAEAAAAAAKAGISEQMAPLSVFRVLLRHPDVAS